MGLYSSVTGDQPLSFERAVQGGQRLPARTDDPFLQQREIENIVATYNAVNPYTKNRNQIVYVSSSNVVAASYDVTTRVLLVEFRRHVKGQGAIAGGGARYEYAGISEPQWNSFKRAGSKGRWVWAMLRRRGVPYRRIR
jgi:hypothetical protein